MRAVRRSFLRVSALAAVLLQLVYPAFLTAAVADDADEWVAICGAQGTLMRFSPEGEPAVIDHLAQCAICPVCPASFAIEEPQPALVAAAYHDGTLADSPTVRLRMSARSAWTSVARFHYPPRAPPAVS